MMTTAIVEDAIGVDEYDLPLSRTQFPPGPELGIELAMTDWSALPDRELVAALDAARRQVAWTQALLLEGVAELSRRRTEEDPHGGSDMHRRIHGEISLELTIPTRQAEELVALAELLPTSLPNTWAALRTGHIDYDRARVMVDGLACADDELTRRLDAELITEAVETTKTVLRRRVARAVKLADPAAHAERTKAARDERRIEVWDNEDETCDLVGRNLDAADAHAIGNRLTAAAQAMKADGDARPVDNIRLDLYRDLLRGLPLPEATRHLVFESADDLDQSERTSEAGPRTHQPSSRHDTSREVIAAAERQITEALADAADEHLTQLFDRARAEGRLGGLAMLIGEATHAMRKALAPIVDSWCRATAETPSKSTPRTDTRPGQGHHGHGGYRPPVALQRLIQRRHTTCVYPTCNRQSIHCDLDHTVPYDKGGRTCRCNLAPLCRTHHRIFKQHWQWKLIQLWPGLLIWVAPAGTWHIVLPQ